MMSHVVLPDDLIVEVLSFLNVKSFQRFKSVSKPWNTLISNPTFVKLHFQRSAPNSHLALIIQHVGVLDFNFLTVPLNHLIENPSITIPINPYFPREIKDCNRIIGSYNGLLCLRGHSATVEHRNIWFRIWNPATNTISKRLEYITSKLTCPTCTFGYDNSTATYKVVVLSEIELSPTEVKILNLRDNSWRTISFPAFHHVNIGHSSFVNEGVYLSGTVNWFAIQSNLSYVFYHPKNITVVLK